MTAECKRINPAHDGPKCSCSGDACALEDVAVERTLLRADIRAGNSEAARMQYDRVRRAENRAEGIDGP